MFPVGIAIKQHRPQYRPDVCRPAQFASSINDVSFWRGLISESSVVNVDWLKAWDQCVVRARNEDCRDAQLNNLFIA